MKDRRFQASIFILFFVGYFLYLKGFYSSENAFLIATVTAILIYLIPIVLVKFVENRGHALASGLLVATIWEFSMAASTRAVSFPAWESFMLAGLGGIITGLLLAFVVPRKEKRSESLGLK